MYNRNQYPEPTNGDVQSCQWYGDARHIEVHLWGQAKISFDSLNNQKWWVRHCTVCGKLDQKYLMGQWEKQEHS